ncbi:MAG TPA: DMT family transporter [Burkholderiales bacterium]|nr:DMT family transporter [Burkholderiales bacterium]
MFLPYVLLSLAVLSWAGNWVIGRAMRHDIGPVTMGFWRWLLALLLILPFCLHELRDKWPVVRQNWWRLMVLGALGAVAFNTMVYVGLQYTEATNSTLFNSVVPIYIVVISWLFFGERITLRQTGGIALSLAGVLVIMSRGDPAFLVRLQINIGDIWIIVAMLLWSVYTVLLRWRPRELSAFAFLGAMLAFSLPLLIPFYGWELYHRGTFELKPATVVTLAYFATVPSVIAYLFWNRGVAEVGANRAGLIIHLLPVFTVVLSILFLGEQLFLFHYVGAVCVFCGITLTNRNLR